MRQPLSPKPTTPVQPRGADSFENQPQTTQPPAASAPTPVKPTPPANDATPRDRFELVGITRRVNGVISAEVKDKLAGTTKELFEYDKQGEFILTKIDINNKTLTFVDAKMKSATISNPAARKVEGHDE